MKNLINLRIIVLAIIVVGVIGSALWLRAASGEDAWLCVDGQWIKHGNPSAAMPDVPCTQAAIPTSKRSEPLPLVPADQPMKTFTAADFSFSYPDWPMMDQKMILEPERTKVAVSNAGCALVVTTRTLPPGTDFQTSIEQLLSEQIAQANVRIIQKDISKNASHVEGEFRIQNRDIRSSQFGYITSKSEFYSIVFAAEKNAFGAACEPMVPALVKSVNVK